MFGPPIDDDGGTGDSDANAEQPDPPEAPEAVAPDDGSYDDDDDPLSEPARPTKQRMRSKQPSHAPGPSCAPDDPLCG